MMAHLEKHSLSSRRYQRFSSGSPSAAALQRQPSAAAFSGAFSCSPFPCAANPHPHHQFLETSLKLPLGDRWPQISEDLRLQRKSQKISAAAPDKSPFSARKEI